MHDEVQYRCITLCLPAKLRCNAAVRQQVLPYSGDRRAIGLRSGGPLPEVMRGRVRRTHCREVAPAFAGCCGLRGGARCALVGPSDRESADLPAPLVRGGRAVGFRAAAFLHNVTADRAIVTRITEGCAGRMAAFAVVQVEW